ncbi:uncharacterized protein [Littorina saxatilis]|uniref:uncharacterized protein n=1 Tax=Littorina saxatilis TaxID=31220 RepID=UPI0038B4346F
MMGTSMLVIIVLLIMGYLVVGTYVFMALEGGYEIQRQADLLNTLEWFLGNNTCISREKLRRVLDFINRDLDTARYVLRHNVTNNVQWDGAGAASFVLSVVTTIGYGHITPKTDNGRIATMVYAMIGIPLILVFLTGIGEKLYSLSRRCLNCHPGRCTSSRARRRCTIFLQGIIGMIIMFVMPTVANVRLERWTTLEAIYYWFITLTTIGFGDLVAGNPVNRDTMDRSDLGAAVRVMNLAWTMVGLSYISMIITSIMKYYVTSTDRVEQQASTRVKKLLQRVGEKLNITTNSTQTADTHHTVFTIPQATSQDDGDLADTLALDMDVKLVRFSVLSEKIQGHDVGCGRENDRPLSTQVSSSSLCGGRCCHFAVKMDRCGVGPKEKSRQSVSSEYSSGCGGCCRFQTGRCCDDFQGNCCLHCHTGEADVGMNAARCSRQQSPQKTATCLHFPLQDLSLKRTPVADNSECSSYPIVIDNNDKSAYARVDISNDGKSCDTSEVDTQSNCNDASDVKKAIVHSSCDKTKQTDNSDTIESEASGRDRVSVEVTVASIDKDGDETTDSKNGSNVNEKNAQLEADNGCDNVSADTNDVTVNSLDESLSTNSNNSSSSNPNQRHLSRVVSDSYNVSSVDVCNETTQPYI